MPENIENLVLEHLRAIRGDITGLREDVRAVKTRLTNLETSVSAIRRDSADMYSGRGGPALPI